MRAIKAGIGTEVPSVKLNATLPANQSPNNEITKNAGIFDISEILKKERGFGRSVSVISPRDRACGIVFVGCGSQTFLVCREIQGQLNRCKAISQRLADVLAYITESHRCK